MQKDKQKLRKKNRCYNCIKSEHHAKDCKVLKKQINTIKRKHENNKLRDTTVGLTPEQEQWVKENLLRQEYVHENVKKSFDGRL